MHNAAIYTTVAIALCNMLVAGKNVTQETPTTITFYSGGSLMKTALPETESATFSGCIFDEQKLLGCITFRGFITLSVAPGKHTFSASLSSRHPAKNSQLEMTMEPGKNYYVRAVEEKYAFHHVLGSSQGRLDVVSCQVAHDETKDSGKMTENKQKTWQRKPAPTEVPPCAAVAP
jgi:hypothetical protein